MAENTDPQRIEDYISELCSVSGLPRNSGNIDNVPLDQRAFQLGINLALSTLQLGPHPDLAGLLRKSIDALGRGRDVQVPKAYSSEERALNGAWTDEQIELVERGYATEREIFKKYFPEAVERA